MEGGTQKKEVVINFIHHSISRVFVEDKEIPLRHPRQDAPVNNGWLLLT